MVLLPAIPVNAAGTINYYELPNPKLASQPGTLKKAQNEALLTPTEAVLVKIWRHVLGLAEVDRFDNFFTLGGQSIQALAMLARAQQQFNRHIAIEQLFIAPTLAGLAASIDLPGTNNQKQPAKSLTPM